MKMSFLSAGFAAALAAASVSEASVVDLSESGVTSVSVTSSRCDGSFGCLLSLSGGFAFTSSLTYNLGALYLHDDSGALRSELWRQDGKRFDAQTLDFGVGARWLMSGPDAFVWADPDNADPWDPDFIDWTSSGALPRQPFFTIRGYRNGVAVANQAFGTYYGAFDFDQTFLDIDYLEFDLSNLNAERYYFPSEDMPANTLWCYEWCVEFTASSLTYALASTTPSPVPLPATGLALSAALMGLGAFARRKATKA